MSLGLISAPLPFMFTETGMVVALAHVLMPYMVLAVWAALQRLDPQIENAAVALGAGPFTVLRRIVLPQVDARHPVGRHHRVRARGHRPSPRRRSSAAGGSRSPRRWPTTSS